MHIDLAPVRYLLENEARVNAVDECNRTPLSIAINTSNAELFNLLIAHGAIPPVHQQKETYR